MALDRGYLGNTVISWIASTGLKVIGTHKRVSGYPFTFSKQNVANTNSQRQYIEEVGAKSLYWDHTTGKHVHRRIYAAAFRQGNGNVATMVHSGNPSMTKFIYMPKMSMKSSDATESA